MDDWRVLVAVPWGTDAIRCIMTVSIVYPIHNGTAAVVLRSVSRTPSGLRLKKSPVRSLSVS
jgi:hypothetical protein